MLALAVFACELREGPVGGAKAQGTDALASSATPVAYPLKVSSGARYLVDQRGVPFMIVGNSPLIGNLSIPNAAVYMETRARYGVNALWINLLCDDGAGCDCEKKPLSS
jgi:hypothetical protein